MQHLIEFLLTRIVKHPADLSVELISSEHRKIYRVTSHPDDIGRIVGSKGRTIKAVRRVASIFAMNKNEGFDIQVVKPDSSSN